MSEKRLDAKNRWRNVVVAFRMSPEEAQELNVKVSLSGLSKQDYIIQCLLKHEIRVARYISELKDKGIIERKGPDNGGKWVIR